LAVQITKKNKYKTMVHVEHLQKRYKTSCKIDKQQQRQHYHRIGKNKAITQQINATRHPPKVGAQPPTPTPPTSGSNVKADNSKTIDKHNMICASIGGVV
jgi:heme-binding NEAT domain protein